MIFSPYKTIVNSANDQNLEHLMKLQTIQISDIKFNDDTFSLTPYLADAPPQKLVQSIGRVGILHPPIVVEIADGIYKIGSGRLRLLAAQQLGMGSCKCNVFKTTAHPLDVFNYIYEEASHTNLPLISKAIFLKKAGQWLSDEELALKFMEGFNLQANTYLVKKLQKLAELELNIQQELLENRIDEKVCHELVKLDFIDRMGLFDIIVKLSLSVGNQRKLLISCREIAIRNKETIASFIGQPSLTTILTNQSLNTPQKTSSFMAQLQELRFPRSSAAEQDFSDFVSHIPLPKHMTISHSPSFEKDELSLTVTCGSKEELLHVIEQLK